MKARRQQEHEATPWQLEGGSAVGSVASPASSMSRYIDTAVAKQVREGGPLEQCGRTSA